MNQQTPSFRITDRVRWSDVDAAGIVCYGSYLRFFEVAETELFRAGEEDVAVEGRYVLVVAIDQESFRPVPLPETVRRALAVGATPQPAAAPGDRGR